MFIVQNFPALSKWDRLSSLPTLYMTQWKLSHEKRILFENKKTSPIFGWHFGTQSWVNRFVRCYRYWLYLINNNCKSWAERNVVPKSEDVYKSATSLSMSVRSLIHTKDRIYRVDGTVQYKVRWPCVYGLKVRGLCLLKYIEKNAQKWLIPSRTLKSSATLPSWEHVKQTKDLDLYWESFGIQGFEGRNVGSDWWQKSCVY